MNYPSNMAWGQMRMTSGVSYLTAADVAAVGTFLDSQRSAERLLRVRFYPDADSLFFHSWEGRGLRFSQNVNDTEGPEVYIMHTSRALPQWMRQEMQDDLRKLAGDQATSPRVLRQRDGTEVWYYAPVYPRKSG